MFETVNPATGQAIATHAVHTSAEVEERLASAESAAINWRRTPLEERTMHLTALAERLDSRRDELAALITTEMGKPLVQAVAEVQKCAKACRHYADAATDYLDRIHIPTGGGTDFVRFDPIGSVMAIMPWNYPFWQVIRFLAPITAAGNTVVLKHAEATMGCGEMIAELVEEAAFPPGVVQTLRIDHQTAAEVIADPRIQAVTFTGSTRGGRTVAAIAGQHGKKTVLELGGSDPFIVLDDADVEAAAKAAVTSRLLNNGQSCVSAKRFLIVPSIAQAFTDAVTGFMADAEVGDPMLATTDVGPLARADLRDVLADQIERSVRAGARPLVAGGIVDGDGYYFAPALLTEVKPDQAVAVEETFGPVAAIIPVDDHDAAVAVANASEYGLGASVWTQDQALAMRVVEDLEAGVVSVNDLVMSDPRLPFGGVKSSGYGRELGAFGLREFTNIKSVHLGG